MKKVIMLFAVALLLLAGKTASAQSQVIRGGERPDLVTDSEAYARVFSHYSNILADPKTSEVQKARLFQRANLSIKDEHILRDILIDHKVRRDAQLDLFNKKVDDLRQRGESIPSFDQIHQFVVSETKGKLAAALSADGLKKLDAFVQREKSAMIVPATE